MGQLVWKYGKGLMVDRILKPAFCGSSYEIDLGLSETRDRLEREARIFSREE